MIISHSLNFDKIENIGKSNFSIPPSENDIKCYALHVTRIQLIYLTMKKRDYLFVNMFLKW